MQICNSGSLRMHSTNAASTHICLAHLYKAPNCKQSVITDYILGMGHNSPTTI